MDTEFSVDLTVFNTEKALIFGFLWPNRSDDDVGCFLHPSLFVAPEQTAK